MLADHGLFFPRILLIARIRARMAVLPISALQCLARVTPGGKPARIHDLALHVESTNEESIAHLPKVLEYRPRVLSHQDGMGGVIVNSKLITDPMTFADTVQGDPRSR